MPNSRGGNSGSSRAGESAATSTAKINEPTAHSPVFEPTVDELRILGDVDHGNRKCLIAVVPRF